MKESVYQVIFLQKKGRIIKLLIKEKLNSGLKLSPSERQLADYIFEYPDRFLKMSIPEVSKQLYVSKSTIIRFAKKLGFVGHKDLCLSLAKELSLETANPVVLDQMRPLAEQIRADTVVQDLLKLYNRVLIRHCGQLDIKQLNRIADMISERRRVILFGLADAYLIASDFQYKLMEIGIDAILPIAPDIFWKQGFNVKNGDITLIISLKGDYRDLFDITSLMNKRESRIVLLEGSEDEKLSMFAEEVVNIECNEGDASMRMIANRTLVTFVLDIIYLLIYLRNEDLLSEK
ncbi:MAG: MurR/RpiR family transcriptional regulator [Solobacterium sp.]|nr:MurR/RpiR family transcriptional regulator [Solobacterium sp.]